MKEVVKLFGTHQYNTTAYHPQTDGLPNFSTVSPDRQEPGIVRLPMYMLKAFRLTVLFDKINRSVVLL